MTDRKDNPAASGAAPADTFRGNNAQLINCINAALSLDLDGCLAQPLGSFGRDLLSAASVRLAALASREASPATLMQAVREYLKRQDEVDQGQDFTNVYFRRLLAARDSSREALDAALASPQVAPAPSHEKHLADQAALIDINRLSIWLAKYGVAADVSPEVLGAEVGQYVNRLTRCEPALAAPVQVAPAEQVARIVHQRANRDRRIYIAGPMTDLPGYNFPAFNAKATELRAEGWHVENPAEHGLVKGARRADYLRWDISRIATCGAIYLLPDWQNSEGACLEVQNGRALDMQFLGESVGIALAAPVAPQDDARDAARLDFLIEREAFVTASKTRIDPTLKYQCWSRDEDEDYRYLSGEHEHFDTAREAIDAAIVLSTPAAKPTEPTPPTQGGAK